MLLFSILMKNMNFLYLIFSLAIGIDVNTKGKLKIIREIFGKLKEEFDGMDSIRLKLMSETEDIQRIIINDHKFQVYINGNFIIFLSFFVILLNLFNFLMNSN